MTTDRGGRRDGGGEAPRRLTIGVRERILATVLLLAALGMTVAGVAFALVEQRQLLDHLDSELTAEASSFERLAAEAPGRGLTDVGTILQAALQRPAQADIVIMGMIDGKPKLVTPDPRPFAIENERALMARLAALPASEPTRIREMVTSFGIVRYVAVQVRVAGRPEHGTFVAAASLAPGSARLAASTREYALVSAGALVLVGVGGWVVAGRLLRPLRLLRTAARRITHEDLAARIPVTGHDDVTDLTRTVNAMLDRLEAAFDTQQQFLDDAGHELRTPLTIVRGHLELLDAADPADVTSVRALVMDELDRMARLVTDLILLAQSRRPDFVRLAPVDLDRLLHSVLGKASALADRHWLVESAIDAVAMADEQRLTQAILQLADNAARHTEPGDVIALGGAVVGERLLLWVRDTGPGVAPQDAERIFERFGRASTTRGREGSGLGLSIVTGIAAAHGGRVSLRQPSAPGACFTLELPFVRVAGGATGASDERSTRVPVRATVGPGLRP
ncbi:MAG TPA: HAMP domain-containing sensor histidine kinase [Kineosporiaceae bacterium]